jgi:hypothetical protein
MEVVVGVAPGQRSRSRFRDCCGCCRRPHWLGICHGAAAYREEAMWEKITQEVWRVNRKKDTVWDVAIVAFLAADAMASISKKTMSFEPMMLMSSPTGPHLDHVYLQPPLT